MMNAKNDFRIPTRYNVQRNDIWLTMRSSPRYGSRGAQAFLRAIDENGAEVQAQNTNAKFFINLDAFVLITPFGYGQM